MTEERDLLQPQEIDWHLFTKDYRTVKSIKRTQKSLIKPLLLLMFLMFSFLNHVSAQQPSDSTVSIERYHYCIIKESRHGHKIFFGSNKFYHKQIDTDSIRWENIVTVLNRMNELGWELMNVKGRSKRSWVLRKRIVTT